MVTISHSHNKRSVTSLEGHIIAATPLLNDSCFGRSVIYICVHNEDGAMGVIINHPHDLIGCNDLIESLHIRDAISVMPQIYNGGPVETDRGFILHSHDYHSSNTFSISEEICLTASVDLLQEIMVGKGPTQSIIALGYAGWAPGQLESEIGSNSWLIAPATCDLIFNTPNEQKWEKCTALSGQDISRFCPTVGYA